MARKPKFKPEVFRVRLNPEQAVLVCCYNTGRFYGSGLYNPTPVSGCVSGGGKSVSYGGACDPEGEGYASGGSSGTKVASS